MRKKKLLYGVGINDADYNIAITELVDGKLKQVWMCPYYRKWKNMMVRCYNKKYLLSYPSYSGCYIAAGWHSLMNFRSWMEKQDWDGKHLDKDILFPNNKIYGPEACVFVDPKVNTFINECTSRKGDLPIGVSYSKSNKKFQAQCQDFILKKYIHLGYFDTPEKAHQAWLDKKIELAYALASQQTDPRVAAALIDRYENYEKHFGGVSSHA